MWVKVAFFVCVRRAIFRGTRVVVGWEFGMAWDGLGGLCLQGLPGAVGPGAVRGLRNRRAGLSEGSCVHEGRRRSSKVISGITQDDF